jgi:peptide/nickel transport system substrate-binding protein
MPQRSNHRFSSTSRSRLLGVAGIAAVTAIALAACSSGAESATPDASSITVVAADRGLGWSFENGGGGQEYKVNNQATLIRKPYEASGQDGILQQDPYQSEPLLADSWTVSPDGLTYTFALSDAVSSAGNELTADDVVWSFEYKFAVPTSSAPSSMGPVITDPATQITKIDDKTVAFTIPQAGMGATLMALLSDLYGLIYDSTLIKSHITDDDPWGASWASNNPNTGFGAYDVVDFQEGSYVRMEARPEYVLGEPDIKTVNIQFVPDAGSRSNAVRDGDADIAQGVTPADSSALADDDDVIVPVIDVPNEFVMMPLLNDKAPFDNELVRQAMSYAVPYDRIVEDSYVGRAVRNSSGFLLTNTPNYVSTGLTDYSYDPEKAKSLLAEAGFPDGVSFTLNIGADAPDTEQVATQIQTAAADAGFDITLEKLPGGEFIDAVVDKSMQAFVFRDQALTLTPGYELGLYTNPDSIPNWANWNSTEYHSLLDAANALPDPYSPEGGEAYNAAEQIYIDEAPIVFIAQVQPASVISSDISGWAWRSDNFLDYSVLTRSAG